MKQPDEGQTLDDLLEKIMTAKRNNYAEEIAWFVLNQYRTGRNSQKDRVILMKEILDEAPDESQ